MRHDERDLLRTAARRIHAWACGAAALACLLTTSAFGEVGEDCSVAYFGIGTEPDYAKAYTCFSGERQQLREAAVLPPGADGVSLYAPLILMRLDGSGVDVDLDEVETLLAEWKQIGGGDEQRLFLRRVLLERRSGLDADDAPIVFCDMPGGRSFRAFCDDIERRKRAAANDRRLEKARESMSPAAQKELGPLVFAFEGYVEREVERVERAQRLDLGGEPLASSHRELVEAHFDEALRRVVVEGDAPEATLLEASRSERDLERTYDEDRREKAAAFATYERSLPDSADEYERLRRAYDEAAQRAHDAWKRYRDAWVDVARASASDASTGEAVTRALLAMQRVKEIRPEPNENTSADLLERAPLR